MKPSLSPLVPLMLLCAGSVLLILVAVWLTERSALLAPDRPTLRAKANARQPARAPEPAAVVAVAEPDGRR